MFSITFTQGLLRGKTISCHPVKLQGNDQVKTYRLLYLTGCHVTTHSSRSSLMTHFPNGAGGWIEQPDWIIMWPGLLFSGPEVTSIVWPYDICITWHLVVEELPFRDGLWALHARWPQPLRVSVSAALSVVCPPEVFDSFGFSCPVFRQRPLHRNTARGGGALRRRVRRRSTRRTHRTCMDMHVSPGR